MPSPNSPAGTHPARSHLRDLKILWLLATTSICAGIFINQFRDRPLPFVYESKSQRLETALGKIANAPRSTPAASPIPVGEVRDLTLSEFQNLASSDGAVILDARPEIFHRLGHVPKAVPMPRDEFDTYYEKHRAFLEADKQRLLLIYCNGSACEDSHLVASALQRLGHLRIAILKGGWAEWTRNNLPEEI